MELTLEEHAALMAELAEAGDDRARVLTAHHLDEDTWAALDDGWQRTLSDALAQDGEGVPEVLARHAAAYEAAQSALAPPISVDLFAEVTRRFQASGDLRAALAKAGVTLADYTRATPYWTRRIATDPEIERRFVEVLRGG